MRFLRQSTATTEWCGPFISPSDGVSPIADPGSQTGSLEAKGTAGASFTPASWAFRTADGSALVGLSTAHTAAVGGFRVSFSAPGTYAPVWEEFHVLSAAVYDWLFGTAAPTSGGPIGTATGASIAADIGAIVTALNPFSKIMATGTIGTVTNSGSFNITFDAAYDGNTAALTDGTFYLSFTSGLNHYKSSRITGGTLTDATHAAVTFTSAFPQAVVAGQTWALITN